MDYQQLAAALISQAGAVAQGGAQFSAALPSSTPTTFNVTGPNGLFTTPGLDNRVFSALSIPNNGLAARLPVFTTNLMNPRMALITGIDSASGAEPVGVCDDPPTAGFIYACEVDFAFGRVERQTMVFDVDRLDQQVRGQPGPLQFIGGVQPTGNALVPTGPAALQQALNNMINVNLMTLGVEYMRKLGRMTYSGNPANNTAGGGYKEFKGLDMLINTGYVDAEAGTACPALDSKVTAFAADIATDPTQIVIAITNMVRHALARADLAGLAPMTFALAMRPEAFYEITEVWPCVYATYRCGGIFAAGDERVVDGLRINEMRDQMRQGLYLLVDGMRVPVVLDYSIVQTEFVANTTYESDIYLVPLTVLGGIPVTYLEARDYRSSAELARMWAGDAYYTSDGGRFLWVRKPVNNFCFQAVVKIEPRLILRTPHLAGRLTDVRYTPTMILPSAYPGEDGYVNGGVQAR